MALKTTGSYEAVGNVLWVHPFPNTNSAADRALAGPDCTWTETLEAETLFEPSVPDGSDTSDEDVKRILLPGTIPLVAPTNDFFLQPVD
jgi:hypothetical protein